MKNTEIRETVAELQELYAVQDVLKAQITEREQAIKDEMESRELEELQPVYPLTLNVTDTTPEALAA